MRSLRNKRGLAVLGMLAVLAGVALWAVLPALASSPGDTVPPASGAGITPTDVGVGGNGTCSNLFPGIAGVREYDNPNPQTATGLASGNGDGVAFTLSLSGTNKAQRLAVSSNAAILGIGINGGTDTTAYDYAGIDWGSGVSKGWVAGDTNLHAPAAKYAGVDSSGTETDVTQWYAISHLTVCYKTAAAISGTAFKDTSGSGSATGAPGIAGLTVTLDDQTSGKQWTTTTGTSGAYSLTAPAGDSYTVCISSPTFTSIETVPTSSTAGSADCSSGGGQAGYGYAVTGLGSGGRSGLDFGFQPYGSVSGTVYADHNQDGTYDSTPSPGDAPLQGWTVDLYDTSSSTPTTPVGSATSDSNGSYTISLPFAVGDSYTVCESPPSTGTWAQSEPRPTAATICSDQTVVANTGALPNGATFTPSTAGAAVTANFGNVPAVPCTEPMGITGFQVLLPGASGCKDNTFAFNSGSDPNRGGKPFVSLLVGDPTLAQVPAAEKITFADPIGTDGQPQYTGIEYTDTFPVVESDVAKMPYCLIDPLDPHNTAAYESGAPSDLLLADTYTTASGSSSVLPSGATSCVISITITAPTASGGAGSLVAYVYSLVDSQAWPY